MNYTVFFIQKDNDPYSKDLAKKISYNICTNLVIAVRKGQRGESACVDLQLSSKEGSKTLRCLKPSSCLRTSIPPTYIFLFPPTSFFIFKSVLPIEKKSHFLSAWDVINSKPFPVRDSLWAEGRCIPLGKKSVAGEHLTDKNSAWLLIIGNTVRTDS